MTRPSGPLHLAAAALACAGAARAQSAPEPINPDRPGVSNGASTVGARRLQLEAGGNAVWEGGEPGLYTLPVTLRYGIGAKAELRLESDTLSVQGREHGVGDLFAGAKWTFSNHNPVLGAMARVRLPTGSRAFRQDGLTPDLTLLANEKLGETWSLEANVLLAGPRDAEGHGHLAQWTYAATLAAAVTHKLQAFAELASVGAVLRDGPRQSLADAGVAYAVSDDLVLDVDVIRGVSAAAPDWGASGGLSVRF